MDWLQIGISVSSGVAAGIASALGAVWRMSAWKARVDERLKVAEARLATGDRYVESVPLLVQAMAGVKEELCEIKRELRAGRETFVTQRECDSRHSQAPTGPKL